MRTILNRTIFKDLFVTFLVTVAFLNSILMMEKLLRLSRLLSEVGATLADIGLIILLLQPQICLMTIPMSLLLATLLVYGRMNQDNEIIVLRASGMDFMRMSQPVAMLGVASFVLSLAFSFYLGPASSVRLRETISTIISSRSIYALEAGTFNTSFKNIVIFIKDKKSPTSIDNVFIYDERKKEEPKVLLAREGTLFLEEGLQIGIYLADGHINMTKGGSMTDLFFDKYKMTLNLDLDTQAAKKMEFTPFELLKKIREEDNRKKKISYRLELHRRFSQPMVCLLLVLLGPPLALMAGKSGKLGGLTLGMIVFALYYMTLIYGENMVLSGKLSHGVGAWAAPALLGIFSSLMFRREHLK